MAIAHSKITAQGLVSVPSEVRMKLGVGPGSILAWEEKGNEKVVRRSRRYTSVDIHAALFPNGVPKRKSASRLKDGIRAHAKHRAARSRSRPGVG